MRAMIGILIALGRIRWRQAVADLGSTERIGDDHRGRPGRSDWRQNLHRQRDQDDRKIFLETPSHRYESTRAQLTTAHAASRDF
jgi:hypothetical protein